MFNENGNGGTAAQEFPAAALATINADSETAGGAYEAEAKKDGRIGVTMFDTPTAEDDTVAVSDAPGQH